MTVTFRALKPEDWFWVHSRCAPKRVQDTKGIIAERDGEIIAACVMDSWTWTSVQVHMAIDQPTVLRHGFLEEIAEYVFDTCDKKVMIGLVPGHIEAALKLNKHIGFTEIFRIEDGFNEGIPYVVMQLRKEHCRWLRNKDGRQRRTGSA